MQPEFLSNADTADETSPPYLITWDGGPPVPAGWQGTLVPCACPGCRTGVRARYAIRGLCLRCLKAGCVPAERAACGKGGRCE